MFILSPVLPLFINLPYKRSRKGQLASVGAIKGGESQHKENLLSSTSGYQKLHKSEKEEQIRVAESLKLRLEGFST